MSEFKIGDVVSLRVDQYQDSNKFVVIGVIPDNPDEDPVGVYQVTIRRLHNGALQKLTVTNHELTLKKDQ